jgi:hypothetical protein
MLMKLKKFCALPPVERRLLLLALLCLSVLRLSLWWMGFRRLQAWLIRRPAPRPSRDGLPDAATLARLVDAAANNLPGHHTCLARSLLLQFMLRRSGIDCQLMIGVRKLDDHLDAHAWIECSGVPVNDQAGVASGYSAFDGPLAARSFVSS